jgi:formate C-acetyltransferase
MIAQQELFPDAFRSALMRDGVKEGKDLLDRRFAFENSSLLALWAGLMLATRSWQ